jgi:hypothetical protein
MLAIYGRPTDWNWLLMFHVMSAFALIGAALVVTSASVYALRRGSPEASLMLRRLALRVNLFFALPAFIAVHLFGQILADREFPSGVKSPGWLDAGFGLTDAFGIFGIIVLSLIQWWALRKARKGPAGWQGTVASGLAPASFALLLVVLFVMSGKPGS